MTRTVHNTENSLYRVDVVNVGDEGDNPLDLNYAIINCDTGVAEYIGRVLPNVLALAEVFDMRLTKFNSGEITEDDAAYDAGPPPEYLN